MPETSARPAAVGKAKPRSFSLIFKFDAAEVAKIALLGLVLAGGYHLVRAIYGTGSAPASSQPRPIAIERLKVHLPVVEAYPSGDRFQARVSAEWDAMDRATRKGKLLKMLLPVLQAGYTSVYLYDQSGALVATWAGGNLTLNDRDGSPGSG